MTKDREVNINNSGDNITDILNTIAKPIFLVTIIKIVLLIKILFLEVHCFRI